MHEPVMVEEVVSILVTDPHGTYVDLNAGLGGHGAAICQRLSRRGRYVGFDLDPAAIAACAARLEAFGERARLIRANHRIFADRLRDEGIDAVNGVLLDLGLSSAQLDETPRGFSFEGEGALDMRYGAEGHSAADLLASLPEAQLARVFRRHGDIRAGGRLARAIVRARRESPVKTSGGLRRLSLEVLRPRPGQTNQTLARVFQALRVAVNDEIGALEGALDGAEELVVSGGVLCVLAYESETDRMVKRRFHPPDPPRDAFGVPLVPPSWERMTRRPLRPGPDEIARNPRARSARLRAARRLESGGTA